MDRTVEVVDGLDPEVLVRVLERVFELEPTTIAILVSGSYAKGTADHQSDLDIQVVTAGSPASPYRMWFEQRPDTKPLHVSPSVKSLDSWLAKREQSQEWALGFPVEHVVRYVWATDEARAALGDPPSNSHPPAEPQLEDFVEFLGKVRRCGSRGDVAGVRVFARAASTLAPGLLRTLNPEFVVRDPREAVEVARSLTVAPKHYREDFEVTFGLVAAEDEAVQRAAIRLGRELLAFLREHDPDADPQPDIARYLADGTLERHLGFLDS